MKKWDYAIIILCAALSLSPLMLFGAGDGGTVTVSVRGAEIYRGSVNRDMEIAVPDTGNVVSVRGGRVTMSQADCPDGLCMQGRATALTPLGCLPNEVVVTVTGEEDGLDGVTY